VDGVVSKVSRPQELLDKMIGTIAFDPLEFSRLRPRDQIDMLKSIVQVDTDKIDVEIEEIFEERKAEARRLRELEARFDGMPFHKDAPAEEVSATELVRKINEVAEENKRRAEIRAAADRTDNALEFAEQDVQ